MGWKLRIQIFLRVLNANNNLPSYFIKSENVVMNKFFETKCYPEFTGSQPPKSCGFNPETGLDQVCCTKEGKSELKLSPRKFG